MPQIYTYLKSTDLSVSIRLPRPEYGNIKKLDMTRINRRSRGGDLIVYSDSIWPKTKTLSLTFSWLSSKTVEELKQFFQQFLGKEIKYFDHLGFIWLGYIMSPAAQVIQQGRNDKTISIEFQGDKI